MWKNYKTDLRKIGKSEMSEELQREVFGEINELTRGKLERISINPVKHTVTIRGLQDNIPSQEEWDIKHYLKTARKYERRMEILDRAKQKYGIQDAYNYPQLGEIIMQKTRTNTRRQIIYKGLENYTKTLEKVTKREIPGIPSKIEWAGLYKRELRTVKFESYTDHDSYIRAAGHNPEKYKYQKGSKKGQFRSYRLYQAYVKLFSEVVIDEDYSDSDFFRFVFNNYVDNEAGETTRTFWEGLSMEEKAQIMKEYRSENKAFEAKVKTDQVSVRKFHKEEGDI